MQNREICLNTFRVSKEKTRHLHDHLTKSLTTDEGVTKSAIYILVLIMDGLFLFKVSRRFDLFVQRWPVTLEQRQD